MLRDVTLDDAALVEKYAGDYDVAKTTSTIPHPYPKGAAEEFLAFSMDGHAKRNFFIQAITLKETAELIGLINITIQKHHKRGELGYWIGKPFWGKGFGTEAAQAMVVFGFKELQLNRIFAQAFTINPGSYRVMEKVGLNYEGTLKQHINRDGTFYDVCIYGVTQKEYEEK